MRHKSGVEELKRQTAVNVKLATQPGIYTDNEVAIELCAPWRREYNSENAFYLYEKRCRWMIMKAYECQ